MAGTVCVFEEERKFEWKINDFLQLENEAVSSPVFRFSDSSWKIDIFPNGQRCTGTVGYIGLRLLPVSLPKPLTVTWTQGLKTVNGKIDLEDTVTELIGKAINALSRSWIILRSDLIKRNSELLPSDALTLVCTLKNREPRVVNERTFLNASVQAGTITESKLLDASAQSEEGIGVWKLQKNLHEISLTGDVSDVILKVGDQEFKSHKCILAARSPVFSAMMKNEMRENVTGVVDIQDVDPKTFSDFLKYLYTGSTKDLTPENVAKLYTTADKYQVEELKEICLDHMLVNVTVENFCDVFIISVQHNEEKLKEICFQYFAKHLLDIIQTCNWQTFLSENPIVANELHIKHIQMHKDVYTLLSNKIN